MLEEAVTSSTREVEVVEGAEKTVGEEAVRLDSTAGTVTVLVMVVVVTVVCC